MSDVVSLAQELIRFPSLNPPGDEKACADFVGRRLKKNGFAMDVYEFAPGRSSLVARLAGSTDLKP